MSKSGAPSVLSQQIETLARPFGEWVTPLFEGIPNPPAKMNEKKYAEQYEAQFVEYAMRPLLQEGEVLKTIQTSALVASKSPDTSFKEFLDLTPKVDLNGTTAPPCSGISLFTFCSTVKWADTYHRYFAKLLIETITAEFLQRLSIASQESSPGVMANILKDTIDVLYPAQPFPHLYEKIRMTNADRWAISINSISTVVPQPSAKVMFEKLSNVKADPKFFCLFKYIYVNEQSNIDINTLDEKLRPAMEIAKKLKQENILHAASMEFFMNVMGYQLIFNKPLCSHRLVYDISELAAVFTKDKAYKNGSAFAMRAVIYTFNQHKKMKLSLDEYIKKYIEIHFTDDLAPYHLDAMTTFIRGQHYAAPCVLARTGEQFKWRTATDRNFIHNCFKLALKFSDKYQHAQYQLAEFLAQCAAQDFEDFIRRYLPEIVKPEFVSRNQFALFLLSRIILSPETNFLKNADNVKDDSYVNQFRTVITREATRVLETIVSQTGPTLIYSCVPFTDSLNLCSPSTTGNLREKKLTICIDRLSVSSAPTKAALPGLKIISNRLLSKWTHNMDPHFKSILLEDFNQRTLDAHPESNNYPVNVDVMALSIFPFLQVDDLTLKTLSKTVFASNPHYASTALRTLEALVIQNPDHFSTIVNAICSISPQSLEFLYLQLQALIGIIQAAHSVHATPTPESLQMMFTISLMGVLSSNYTDRLFAFTLISAIENISQEQSPSLYRFFSKYDLQVANLLQKLVLFVGNYFDSTPDLDPILFQAIASSKADGLFLFAISAMGQIMAKSEFQPYLEAATATLVNSCSNFEKVSPLYYLNLVVFLSSLHKQGHFEFISQCTSNCVAVIKQLAKHPEFALFAFFTAMPFELCLDQLSCLSLTNALDLHVYCGLLRHLLDDYERSQHYLLRSITQVMKTLTSTFAVSSPKLVFKCKEIPGDNQVKLALYNILVCISTVYSKIFDKEASVPHGPYLRVKAIQGSASKQTDSLQNDNEMYAFLLNLGTLKSAGVMNELIKNAISSFARVYQIPDENFNFLCGSMQQICAISPCAFSNILNRFFTNILPEFIAKSYTDHNFFKAISQLFVDNENLADYLAQWESTTIQQMNQQEREFTSIAYSSSGALVALALFKLSSLKSEERIDGFRVLVNTTISAIFLSTEKVNITSLVAKLIQLKQTIVAVNPELIEKQLRSLSVELRKLMAFCAEDFLQTAFKIVSHHPDSALFTSTIVAWIQSIVFNNDKEGIFEPPTPSEFVRFSSYSFVKLFIEQVVTVPLNRNVVTMIDNFLEMPCKDEKTTLEFLVICIYNLQTESESNQAKCIALMAYLLSQHPQEIAPIASQYFTLQGWFYHQIQLSRIDLQFDINKFMEGFQNSKHSNDAMEQASATDQAPLYESMMVFSIKFIQTVAEENPLGTMPFLFSVIPFCMVNYGFFDGATSKLLDTLVAATPVLCKSAQFNETIPTADIAKLAEICGVQTPSTFVSIYKLISLLPEYVRVSMREECLKWACTCGEIGTAIRGAYLCLLVMKQSNEEAVNAIIRTFRVVVDVIHERSDPQFSNKSAQWLAVVVEKTTPDYPLAYHYLATLLRLLEQSLRCMNAPIEAAYNVAISCLECKFSEQTKVVTAALSLMKFCLSDPRFRKMVDGLSKKGVLSALLDIEHNAESLQLSLDLVVLLMENEALQALGAPAEVVLVSILPYFYLQHEVTDTEQLVEAMATLIKLKDAQKLLRAKQYPNITDFAATIMPGIAVQVDKSVFVKIVGFYTTMAKVDQDRYLDPVLGVCTAFLRLPVMMAPVECYAELGYKAVQAKEAKLATMVLIFLTTYNDKGGIIKNVGPSKKMRRFPGIPFDTYLPISTWKPTEPDTFQKIEQIPPISIIDVELLGTPSQNPIQVIVQLVKVVPFTDWSETLFKAESMNVQQIGRLAQAEDVSVRDDVHEYFDEISTALTNPTMFANDDDLTTRVRPMAQQLVSSGSPLAPQSQIMTTSTVSISDYVCSFCNMASSEFVPSHADIDKLGGNDILSGFSVSTYFPLDD